MLFTPRFSHSTKTFFLLFTRVNKRGGSGKNIQNSDLEKFKPFYFLHYAETNLSSSLIWWLINRGDSRIFNSQRERERVNFFDRLNCFNLNQLKSFLTSIFLTTCQTTHELCLSRFEWIKVRGREYCVGAGLPKSFHIKNLSVSSLWIISIRGNLPNIN